MVSSATIWRGEAKPGDNSSQSGQPGDQTQPDSSDGSDDLKPSKGNAGEGESDAGSSGENSRMPEEPTHRPRRLAWAELLRRVFAADVLECPRCGGRMRLLAAIHPPEATQAILECLELPARAPPTAAPLPDDTEAEAGEVWDFEASP